MTPIIPHASDHLVVIASTDEIKLIPECFQGLPILITGTGALNIIKHLQAVPRETVIVNIGYCGSGAFPIGATVQIEECDLWHPRVSYTEPRYTHMIQTSCCNIADLPKATCHTLTDFGGDASLEGCVFDMELAFILALGFERVISLKTVSDNCNLQQYHETIATP